MSDSKQLYRVLDKGGVLSPVLLSHVLSIAEEAGNQDIFLGSRQDILFYLPRGVDHQKHELSDMELHPRNSGIQNVVSSYVCVDILPSTSWVHSGTYLKILDQFQYNHSLRVNIVDPRQNLVPLFYGHINFLASTTPNYWHLYFNLDDKKDPQSWSELIFTDDVAEFAKELETLIIKHKISNPEQLKLLLIDSQLQKHTLEHSNEITLPKGFFPYYEGLNKTNGKDTFWAGFYWRNNQYPISFLKEVCQLCKQTNVVRIYFTPWKTFLIKDIEPHHKILWEELIGRYGINMRHSSFELNWHLPLLNTQALKLKRYLVSEFDKVDIRTFGLSFSIQDKPGERFTTIVIRSKSRLPFLGRFDFTRTYSIEHAYDFNPNNNHYIEYAGNLVKEELPTKLNEISKRYYARLAVQNHYGRITKSKNNKKENFTVHQCPDCLTVYDQRFGDVLAEIEVGVSFEQLPIDYTCQVCESPKSTFVQLQLTEPIGS